MPLHNKRAVRILNPASGSGWTSRRRAREYVRQGRAQERPDGSIEFIGSDPQCMAVRLSAENDYDRAAHSGIADVESIRNLPVVGPVERLLTIKRRRAVLAKGH
jgi:hypothetical protein